MWDIKACRVCFSTTGNFYNLNIETLRIDFNIISGLQTVKGNGMPDYLCTECNAYVKKFKKFRNKCHRAHYVLQQILNKQSEIKLSHLEIINRQQLELMPTLSFLPVVLFSMVTNQDTFVQNKNSLKEREIKVEVDKSNVFNQNIPVNSIQTTQKPEKASSNQVKPNTRGSTIDYPQLPLLNKVENFTHNLFNIDDNPDIDIETENTEDFELNSEDVTIDEEEFGTRVPLSVKEAKAVLEVLKYTSAGEFVCRCGMKFHKKERYNLHIRRHGSTHFKSHYCDICDSYFKTENLLESHKNDNHNYKYICKKCPEVSFSSAAAKHHYVNKHIKQGNKSDGHIWDVLQRSTWLSNKGGPKRVKGLPSNKQTSKRKKNPPDFPSYTPISQEEQYRMVEQRKESRNYLEAKFKCELCYRGYRLTSTYNKHMAKHDPEKSGVNQCDMCKLYFPDTRKLYKHMFNYHLFKYCCRYCDFVCTNKGQALYHYKWHKNVTYDCPHCDKKFSKISTQLTHIRFKHPSTSLCNLCGHSFVSAGGLNCHKQMSHTKQEIELSEAMSAANDPTAAFYCGECRMQFCSEQAYCTHLGSSRKHVDTNVSVVKCELANRRSERQRAPRSEILNTGTSTATHCEVCGKYLSNDVVAHRHYRAEHPGTDFLKRYMCDVCGHTTKQYANLLAHMRVHTREKPYPCPHCARRFSMPSNRDRHLVVHTGEKRYQCQHCSRRFTQSTAVKLHIQTVHLKIPYKPWDKKNRKRRKEMEPTTAGLDVLIPPAPAPAQPQAKIILEPQTKILLEPQEYITYISYTNEQ